MKDIYLTDKELVDAGIESPPLKFAPAYTARLIDTKAGFEVKLLHYSYDPLNFTHTFTVEPFLSPPAKERDHE